MRLGIIGATGEVGRMMLRVLQEREIRVTDLQLFASGRSEGTELDFRGKGYKVRKLTAKAMEEQFDFLFCSAGSSIAREYAPLAEKAGSIIIDNSSAFRHSHPLIVPEINGSLIKGYKGIIANPNCSTIQLVLALHPLHLRFEMSELIISTYQSVSGSGYQGIRALMEEREGSLKESPYPREIDCNIIPQIGVFDENGDSEEERKMVFEIRKIFDKQDLQIGVTTVRVPVIYGHAESVFARFHRRVELNEISTLYSSFPAVEYYKENYITPKEIDESDQTHVARIRRGTDDHSLLLWNVAHNVRLGAATNAVKILQYVIGM